MCVKIIFQTGAFKGEITIILPLRFRNLNFGLEFFTNYFIKNDYTYGKQKYDVHMIDYTYIYGLEHPKIWRRNKRTAPKSSDQSHVSTGSTMEDMEKDRVLVSITAPAPGTSQCKLCPMCEAMFPISAEEEFEQHVMDHFSYDSDQETLQYLGQDSDLGDNSEDIQTDHLWFYHNNIISIFKSIILIKLHFYQHNLLPSTMRKIK